MTFTLRPYQQEALDAIVNNSINGINKQLVVLPTGAGKTVGEAISSTKVSKVIGDILTKELKCGLE
jgi:superfamily II DNA or RNA helicase